MFETRNTSDIFKGTLQFMNWMISFWWQVLKWNVAIILLFNKSSVNDIDRLIVAELSRQRRIGSYSCQMVWMEIRPGQSQDLTPCMGIWVLAADVFHRIQVRVPVLWATQAGDTFKVSRQTASDDKTAMWKSWATQSSGKFGLPERLLQARSRQAYDRV